MISYLKGDVTKPQGSGRRIIAHICNDRGGFGKGVALALANRWPNTKAYFKRWYASKDDFELGATQLVEVADDLWVANMVAQHGYKSPSNPTPLDYEALQQCLTKLAIEADTRQASIHMPRIGCSLAGGSWGKVEPLIETTLRRHSVCVYDLQGGGVRFNP